MRVILQRVKYASVTVENKITGKIEHGLLLLVGFHPEDTDKKIEWMCQKILKMRIFEDEAGKMNLSVQDVKGGLLVVSQFTLYANTEKGNRPSFIEAAKPEIANKIYDNMISYFRENSDLEVETGIFGAMMDVTFVNNGPVTIILEK